MKDNGGIDWGSTDILKRAIPRCQMFNFQIYAKQKPLISKFNKAMNYAQLNNLPRTFHRNTFTG